MKRLINQSSMYVKSSTISDVSDYRIVGFTNAEYNRLKQCVKNNIIYDDNAFGYIEHKTEPFAIDVIAEDINGRIVPEWNTYTVSPDGIDIDDMITGGSIDVSLNYDEMLTFLINTLEDTIRKYNK